VTDPLGTAELRAAVLAAWAASATRFREDANAEDDLVRGGYRDRLVVELAQNAADAAVAAGVPGRLLLRITDDALLAANSGRPLTRAGVASLASLRASAKEAPESAGSPVGRFGVGFAAVLAVTDEPRVLSADGGVAFSATATRAAVAGIEQVAAELARRAGHVPVLRLPFATTDQAQAGYDTTVVLPWRDAAAVELGRSALDAVDASLLLALPALSEVVIESGSDRRTLSRIDSSVEAAATTVTIAETTGAARSTTRWRLSGGSGEVGVELVAGLPVEERGRRSWWWTWALPVDETGRPVPLPSSVPAVVHAPTPTDEPLDLPALLMASFPLDASRRAVVGGPLTDRLSDASALGYVELVVAIAAARGADALTLVPGPVGVGAVDGHIRERVRTELPGRPIANAAEGEALTAVPGSRLRALDVSDDALVRLLADAYAGLVGAEWLRDPRALSALGIASVRLTDVLDEVASVHRPAAWWHAVYVELDRLLASGQVPRNALDGLPVPTADGRTVRGPRGAVIAGDELEPQLLAELGLRVVEAAAAHPLLERLGASIADAGVVLDDPAVRARVADAVTSDDPEALARAVLALVSTAPELAATRPWLRRLALTDVDGDWAAAADLLLPGSVLVGCIDAEALGTVEQHWLDEFGADTLRAIGVVDDFVTLTAHDVTLDADLIDAELGVFGGDPAVEVDGFADWADAARRQVGETGEAPPSAPEVRVLTDLELVRDDAWGQVLPRISAAPLRDVVVASTRLVTADGRIVSVPSYAAWWLAEAPLIDSRRPSHYRLADVDPRLRGLYLDVADVADPEFLTAVGVRSSVEALLAEPDGAAELLDVMVTADPAPDAAQVGRLYKALSQWASRTPDDRWPEPPERLRVGSADATVVVARKSCSVAVAPHHLPLTDASVVAGDTALADLLGVVLLDPRGRIGDPGQLRAVPAAVGRLVGLDEVDYFEHDDLRVDGREVEWWLTDAGELHAATISGLARALAWRTGQWSRRWQLAAALTDPDAAQPTGENAFDLG